MSDPVSMRNSNIEQGTDDALVIAAAALSGKGAKVALIEQKIKRGQVNIFQN